MRCTRVHAFACVAYGFTSRPCIAGTLRFIKAVKLYRETCSHSYSLQNTRRQTAQASNAARLGAGWGGSPTPRAPPRALHRGLQLGVVLLAKVERVRARRHRVRVSAAAARRRRAPRRPRGAIGLIQRSDERRRPVEAWLGPRGARPARRRLLLLTIAPRRRRRLLLVGVDRLGRFGRRRRAKLGLLLLLEGDLHIASHVYMHVQCAMCNVQCAGCGRVWCVCVVSAVWMLPSSSSAVRGVRETEWGTVREREKTWRVRSESGGREVVRARCACVQCTRSRYWESQILCRF